MKPQADPNEAKNAKVVRQGRVREEPHDKQRSHAASQVSARKEDSLRGPSLPLGNPARKRFRHTGPGTSLTCAKEESRQQKRNVTERTGGGDRESRRTDDD